MFKRILFGLLTFLTTVSLHLNANATQLICGYVTNMYIPSFTYDPSQASDTIVNMSMNVYERSPPSRGNAGSVCNQSYAAKLFTWSEEGGAKPTIAGLEYEIIAPNSANIAQFSQPIGVPSQHYAESFSNTNRSIQMQLRIPAGQNISGGNHSGQVHWDQRRSTRECTTSRRSYWHSFGWGGGGHYHYYTNYNNCGPFTTTSIQSSRAVNITVPDTMSLNIAGAGVSKTLDFGVLHSGDTKNVNIQARATSAFKIGFTSDMGGSLKLNGDDSSSWSIPYVATLDGSPITDASPYINNAAVGTNGLDLSLPFIVTIGDMTDKRAGTYSDIITLKVERVL